MSQAKLCILMVIPEIVVVIFVEVLYFKHTILVKRHEFQAARHNRCN